MRAMAGDSAAFPDRRVEPAPPRFAGPRHRTRSWPCPRPSDFSILVVHARDDVLLQLSGHLDVEGSQAFDDCVAAAVVERPRRLVLDLAGLESMDLVGVGCLTRARERSERDGVQVVLDAPNVAVQSVLEAAKIYDDFSVR
jgi:anti-anti-sigma factor